MLTEMVSYRVPRALKNIKGVLPAIKVMPKAAAQMFVTIWEWECIVKAVFSVLLCSF